MRHSYFIAATVLIATACRAGQLTLDQRLIVSCHRLDVNGVVAALRDGANVNGRFGDADAKLFQDPWSLGWPMAAKKWTPLIAVANASNYPDPPRTVQSTVEDLDWAREQRKKIPPEQIEARQRATGTIALILLSHRAEIDADDGYGATALFDAISERKLDLANLLLLFDANVNTKTGIYIDGPGDITPLHEAYWSAELTKLLLDKGADRTAKDSRGRTPADWARSSHDPAVRRLYDSH